MSRCFDARQVLDCIDIVIPGGTSCALSGPSGRGKSTLLSILGGFDAPDSGTITWDQQTITAPLRRVQRRKVTLLTQHPRLERSLSVRENILLFTAFGRPADPALLEHLLHKLGLHELSSQPAHTMSGGQIIRAALIRCLLPQPRLLLADEPTASLDPATAQAVTDTLLECCKELGSTVIIASHDPYLIAQCDQHVELA